VILRVAHLANECNQHLFSLMGWIMRSTLEVEDTCKLRYNVQLFLTLLWTLAVGSDASLRTGRTDIAETRWQSRE